MRERRTVDGRRLRDRREALDLSLSELAEKAETVKSHLSEIENGRKVPSVALALDLAAALGTSVEALFGAEPAPPIKPELIEAYAMHRTVREAHRILDHAVRGMTSTAARTCCKDYALPQHCDGPACPRYVGGSVASESQR